MTTTKPPKFKTADDYFGAIGSGWSKSSKGILRAAEFVAAAWTHLNKIERENLNLLFGAKQCTRLRKIAAYRPFYRSQVHLRLPPSIGTLEELSRLTAKQFDEAYGEGLVTARITRAAATALRTGQRTEPMSKRFPDTRKFVSIRIGRSLTDEQTLTALRKTLERALTKFKEQRSTSEVFIDEG